MAGLTDLPLEDRVAYLEERLDQTAGRLQAALEILDIATHILFTSANRETWERMRRHVRKECPPDASAEYRDAMESVADWMLTHRAEVHGG